MKIKLAIIFILSLIFGILILLRGYVFKANTQNNAKGSLMIESSPSASVFIDDNLVGKTPIQSITLGVGEHKIKLIPEGIAKNITTWQGKIQITKNSLSFLSVNLGKTNANIAVTSAYIKPVKEKTKKGTGIIEVQTDPQGAIIYLDNDEKGTAPLKIIDVIAGEHEVKATLPFFFNRTQKIMVEQGNHVVIFFKLAIDESKKKIKLPEEKESTKEAQIQEQKTLFKVKIKTTPTGWLRVRENPGLGGKELAKIKIGSTFEVLEEKQGWYKIKFNNKEDDLEEGKFEEGWISSRYAQKIDSDTQNAEQTPTPSEE